MRLMLAALMIALAAPAFAEPPAPPWLSPLAQDHPLVGRIWLPNSHAFIEPAELANRLRAADFVLLGERHDNLDHHRLEAWSLDQVIADGRHRVVAFEMIGPEQIPALEKYRRDHPADADGLAEALDWAHSHWPDWSNYQPMFSAAITADLPIRAANLAQDTLRAIARGRDLTPETRRFYRIDQPLDGPIAAAMAAEIREFPLRPVARASGSRNGRRAARPRCRHGPCPGRRRSRRRGADCRRRTLPHRSWCPPSSFHPGAGPFHLSLAFVEVADDGPVPQDYGEAGHGATALRRSVVHAQSQ